MTSANPPFRVGALTFDVGGVRTDVAFVSEPACPEASVTVLDANTALHFGAGAANPVRLPAGEKAKQWESVHAVLARCTERGLGRDATIAGIGGGVICDITAFAASLYMRGCRLTLVPTTLLAMVDASLGGKTGIDFLGYKNLVGTFYPAHRIVIAPSALKSLSQREYLSGLAEVVKTALIGDADLLQLVEKEQERILSRDPAVVEEMIRRSLAVKGRIVEEDPREKGIRAVLNLGHTFGHALESASGFTGWTHGEAVAWGIGRALSAGLKFGMTDPAFSRRVRVLLLRYGYRLDADVAFEALQPAFGLDKKRTSGGVRLVIPCGVGDVRLCDAAPEDLAAALADRDPGGEEHTSP
jgi:3-dehydroquinate synthase